MHIGTIKLAGGGGGGGGHHKTLYSLLGDGLTGYYCNSFVFNAHHY